MSSPHLHPHALDLHLLYLFVYQPSNLFIDFVENLPYCIAELNQYLGTCNLIPPKEMDHQWAYGFSRMLPPSTPFTGLSFAPFKSTTQFLVLSRVKCRLILYSNSSSSCLRWLSSIFLQFETISVMCLSNSSSRQTEPQKAPTRNCYSEIFWKGLVWLGPTITLCRLSYFQWVQSFHFVCNKILQWMSLKSDSNWI